MLHLFFYYYLVPVVAVGAGVGAVELVRVAADLTGRLGRRIGGRGIDEVSPRKISFLARILSPRGVGIAIALVIGGAFVATQARSIDRLAWESYRYYGSTDRGLPRGLPHVSQLDHAIIGKLINRLSQPDDLVLIHRRAFRPSVTFHYYLWRRTSSSMSTRWLDRGDFLLVREAQLNREDQARLASRYPVVRAIGFLIYDLCHDGDVPAARQLDYEILPRSLGFSYFRSAFYPPFRLEENEAGARAYLERLGLGTAG